MTNYEALEAELDTLDVPMVGVDIILIVLGDALDIDPLTLIDSYLDSAAMANLRDEHGSTAINSMVDLLGEGLESSTQLPDIRRAIELNLEMGQMDPS